MKKKVFVIGLDGATFDVINPLIEDGRMPYLKWLIENGAYGSLLSTIPPVTGAAWLSLATGMDPENTGIFDFFHCHSDNYYLKGLNSSFFKGCSIWDYLSQSGKQVGIFNYPMLKPPYEVNGFMTTGIGASPNEEYTYDKNVELELNRVTGGKYEFIVPFHHPRYNNTDLFLKDLHRVFTKQTDATEYLLRKKEWDFFCVIFSATDWLQHIMWRHIDEDHPMHEGRHSEKYDNSFMEFWAQIDNSINRFHRLLGEETYLIILSDHGFGPNDQVFKINAWLEREGFLERKVGRDKLLNTTKRFVRSSFSTITRKLNLDILNPSLFEWGRKATSKFLLNALDQIDLAKSQAFDPGHSIPFGGIYLNDRLIDTQEAKQRLACRILESLREWGRKHDVKVDIWRPLHKNGPDLIVAINDWRCVILKDQFNGELFEPRPYSQRHTGSHRMNGLFIAVGPHIQNTALDKARICDVTPTLLYLFDEPIPRHMDGQVITEIFKPEFLKHHPPRNRTDVLTEKRTKRREAGRELTEEEETALKKQLRGLGYL